MVDPKGSCAQVNEAPDLFDLSIIITAYNDEPAIPALAAEITRSLDAAGLMWEAIWIDDGSRDRTVEALRALPSPHRFLRFERNQGQSAGYRAGAEAARGQWLATLDGDGQNDPADLPGLLRYARDRNVDYVNGIRAVRRDPWLRVISARWANRIRNLVTRVRITDSGCATRVMKRELFLRLPFFHGNYYYFPMLVAMLGGSFAEAPVNHRKRQSGTANYGIRNRLLPGLIDLLGVCWLRRRHRSWSIVERS